jgi:hypothetical protein
VHYVVRASILLPLSGPLSQRAIAVLVCVQSLTGCLIQLHKCFRVVLFGYSIWLSISLFLLFETYYGALVMVRSTFDLSLWIILVFHGLADPHS